MIESGVTHFLSGMALGIDIYAAEIVLSLREEFPEISLEAIIPCANQSCKWSKMQVFNYFTILKQCNKVVVLQDNYTPDCMNKRNRYMVEHSDCAIAVWNGSNSGTGNTVKYALSKKLPVIMLHPYSYSVLKI